MNASTEPNLSELIQQVNSITVITEPDAGRIDMRTKLSALWERVFVVFQPKVDGLSQEVADLKITSQESYDRAATTLRDIKATRLDLARFKAIPDKLYSLWKENLAEYQNHDKVLDMAEVSLKNQIIAFDRKKQREEDAERSRQEAIARRKAQDEADARAKAAQKAGATKTEVAEIKKSAEFVPPVEVKPNLERAAGQSISENWQAEVMRDSRGNLVESEFAKLLAYIVTGKEGKEVKSIAHPELLCILEVNEPVLRKLAKAQKSALKLPAVKVFDKGSLRASAF